MTVLSNKVESDCLKNIYIWHLYRIAGNAVTGDMPKCTIFTGIPTKVINKRNCDDRY